MNEQRDWPLTLKLNAAACKLAPAIYYARHDVYGGNGRHWDALSTESRSTFIAIAAAVLSHVAPAAKPKPALQMVKR